MVTTINRWFLGIVVLLGLSTAFADTPSIFRTYTTLSGYYDWQSIFRTPQYIRVDPVTGNIHVIMMVSDDSLDPNGPLRGTAYAFSSNGGATWNNFNQVRVPNNRRSGYPTIDLLNGANQGLPAIANHSAITGEQSAVFVDSPPGSGAFAELNSPPLLYPPVSGGEPIWPEIAGPPDGSIVLVGCVNSPSVVPAYITRASDFMSWANWMQTPGMNCSGDNYVVEANESSRVGIVQSHPEQAVLFLESTDNGQSWPGSAVQLLPPFIVVGNDTFVVTVGLDFVYNGNAPQVTFGVTKLVGGVMSHRHAGIGFWSPLTGFVLAVPHDRISGVVDTLKYQASFPVCYPAIGMSGSRIVMSFQAFMAETSATGYNYSDVFFTHSPDSGSTWTYPVNLSGTDSLDERYPSMSKRNAANNANMVWHEDPEPGSIVFGAPASLCRQVFYRDIVVGVDDDNDGTPGHFTLSQNYPNPFNSATVMSYELRVKSRVRLVVYDLLGREVATLVNEVKAPGTYTATWDGGRFASGMYFCRLAAGGYVQTRKMVLVR